MLPDELGGTRKAPLTVLGYPNRMGDLTNQTLERCRVLSTESSIVDS